MKSALLNPDVQDFINSKVDIAIAKLAFEKNPFTDVLWADILNQISCKSKAKTKLPTFFGCKNIVYPSKVSMEQTSSEKTASYKAEIISGNSIIDLTGGFGADDFYFAKRFKTVFYCEMNFDLYNIVKHNFEQLASTNINCFFGDSLEILKKIDQKFDWIYIDPSRRNDEKGKVFMLNDCEPNVSENIDFYFEKSANIFIKTAPLLDISAGIRELIHVKEIHVVAIENEVKELLWILNKNYEVHIKIKTINFSRDKMQKFEFDFENKNQFSNFGLPQKYLYEPNAAIMKSGGFDAISAQFELLKLHQNTHLYTSLFLIEFPGRVFEILEKLEYNKPNIAKHLKNKQANITTRNFVETVAQIRDKWKIKDGGNNYCFFTTDINNKTIFLICKKLV